MAGNIPKDPGIKDDKNPQVSLAGQNVASGGTNFSLPQGTSRHSNIQASADPSSRQPQTGPPPTSGQAQSHPSGPDIAAQNAARKAVLDEIAARALHQGQGSKLPEPKVGATQDRRLQSPQAAQNAVPRILSASFQTTTSSRAVTPRSTGAISGTDMPTASTHASTSGGSPSRPQPFGPVPPPMTGKPRVKRGVPKLPPRGYPLAINRTSFNVGGVWDVAQSRIVEHIYVEKLEAVNSAEKFNTPLVLIHGDYHDGSIWHNKPDGERGWAEWFAAAGFTVYIPDLPFHGRSKLEHYHLIDRIQYLEASIIENELTAPEKSAVHSPDYFDISRRHSQWPGTGKRGDPIFDNYAQRLNPEYYNRRVRQNVSQYALFNLLRTTGPAVLIGQGMGGNIAMLGVDANPQLVLGVIAIEPTGPPFGSATKLNFFNERVHMKDWEYVKDLRPYGISDVPINYDPPANMAGLEAVDEGDNHGEEQFPPIPVEKVFNHEREASCYLQNPNLVIRAGEFLDHNGELQDYEFKNPIRKLTNISQRPVAIITAEASPHALYDWATVQFLKQAGVRVLHLELGKRGIYGNGHLCFLEKNSDIIADLTFRWILRFIPSVTHNAHLVPDHIWAEMQQPRSGTAKSGQMEGHNANHGSASQGSPSDPIAGSGSHELPAQKSPTEAIRQRKASSSILVSRSSGGLITVRWQPGSTPTKKALQDPHPKLTGTPSEQAQYEPMDLDSPTPAPRRHESLTGYSLMGTPSGPAPDRTISSSSSVPSGGSAFTQRLLASGSPGTARQNFMAEQARTIASFMPADNSQIQGGLAAPRVPTETNNYLSQSRRQPSISMSGTSVMNNTTAGLSQQAPLSLSTNKRSVDNSNNDAQGPSAKKSKIMGGGTDRAETSFRGKAAGKAVASKQPSFADPGAGFDVAAPRLSLTNPGLGPGHVVSAAPAAYSASQTHQSSSTHRTQAHDRIWSHGNPGNALSGPSGDPHTGAAAPVHAGSTSMNAPSSSAHKAEDSEQGRINYLPPPVPNVKPPVTRSVVKNPNRRGGAHTGETTIVRPTGESTSLRGLCGSGGSGGSPAIGRLTGGSSGSRFGLASQLHSPAGVHAGTPSSGTVQSSGTQATDLAFRPKASFLSGEGTGNKGTTETTQANPPDSSTGAIGNGNAPAVKKRASGKRKQAAETADQADKSRKDSKEADEDESSIPYQNRKKRGPRGPYLTKKRRAEMEAAAQEAQKAASKEESLAEAGQPSAGTPPLTLAHAETSPVAATAAATLAGSLSESPAVPTRPTLAPPVITPAMAAAKHTGGNGAAPAQ